MSVLVSLTLKENPARARLVEAGDHVEDCRLARAVGANKTVNGTLLQLEREIVDRGQTGKVSMPSLGPQISLFVH